jgi:WD40 repeat protein
MRYLRFWDDSIRGELGPRYVANVGRKLMTCKIFTNEIPLGHVNYSDFIELVVQQGLRPERPDFEDAPQLSDAVWGLAKKCWMKDPQQRPTASTLCDAISYLLGTTGIAQLIPAPSPLLHLIALPSVAPGLRSLVQVSPHPPLNFPPSLTIRGHTAEVLCATFSPDGRYIASGSADRTIMVWDAHIGNLVLGPLKMHTTDIYCVAFSLDGSQIASGSVDGTIWVLDITAGKVVLGPCQGHTSAIWAVSFSPDGRQIASGSEDKTIVVRHAHTGDVVSRLSGHTDSIDAVAFSTDGKRLASGSDDMSVRVWHVKSGKVVQGPLRGHKDHVYLVVFSPDGKRVISASRGGNVCVWDIETGALVFGPSKRHVEGILAGDYTPNTTCCAVSPDGKWIASGYSSTVYVWDSQTGRLVATFDPHTDYVPCVSFAPDSKRILSVSYDQTIQVHTLDW